MSSAATTAAANRSRPRDTTPGGLGQIPGFRSNVEGLAGSTASGSFWYDLPYYVAWFLLYLGMAAVILIPFVLLFIYERYGREKTFVVPAYLSTIPYPSKKPWQVNLLFKGDAMEFDKDGFYATLLDLHRRKIIAITEKGGGKSIEIRKLSAATTDPYDCGCWPLSTSFPRMASSIRQNSGN